MNKHFKVNPASYELYYDFEQKKGIQSSLTLSSLNFQKLQGETVFISIISNLIYLPT